MTAPAGVRKYSAAYFISVGRIFLPTYSGVRPTMASGDEHGDDGQHQDAVHAGSIPPGALAAATSSSATAPPNGVSESWKQFTAPVEVTVVDAAHSEHPGVPNRTSVPSEAPPASCDATPACCISKKLIPPTAAAQMMTMTASSA